MTMYCGSCGFECKEHDNFESCACLVKCFIEIKAVHTYETEQENYMYYAEGYLRIVGNDMYISSEQFEEYEEWWEDYCRIPEGQLMFIAFEDNEESMKLIPCAKPIVG